MKISVLASACVLEGADRSSGIGINDRIGTRGLALARFSGQPGNERGSFKRATPPADAMELFFSHLVHPFMLPYFTVSVIEAEQEILRQQ